MHAPLLQQTGTHDIQELQNKTSAMDVGSINLLAVYSEHSCAAGALFILLFVNDNGTVDFTRSAYLALNRTTSLDYTPPYSGQYQVFVYDIEQDGTLHNGVGYPAATTEFSIGQDREGMLVMFYAILQIPSSSQ